MGAYISFFQKKIHLEDKTRQYLYTRDFSKNVSPDTKRDIPETKRDVSDTNQDIISEDYYRKLPKSLIISGLMLVITLLALTFAASFLLLFVFYHIHIAAGVVVESIMTAQVLSTKSLKTESRKVYTDLAAGDIQRARYDLSMIVGRDTDQLDEEHIAKAAVETVAENTSDGVIAPIFYTFLFGAAGGMVYKAVNTMDSMVGYKNDKYLYFGRCAARLDDAAGFIPARIAAWVMIFSTVFSSKFNTSDAIRIYRRDRNKPASPNAGQTEAVMAGAIGIRLGGDAPYFGKIVKKPFLGDELRPTTATDILLSHRLLYAVSFICAIIFILLTAFCIVFAG